jgi:hypothetical protein
VELIFSTKTTKGKISKNARISCNDSVRAAITIDFSANILPNPDSLSSVKINPDQIFFSKDTTKAEVKVENLDSNQVQLTQVGSLPYGVSAKIKNSPVKSGKSALLQFTRKGEAPEYDANYVATFDTGIKSVARFSVPYTVRGTKGPKPGAVPSHGAPATVKPTTAGEKTPNTPGQMRNATSEKENLKQVSPDSVKLEKPLPGTQQWPPK